MIKVNYQGMSWFNHFVSYNDQWYNQHNLELQLLVLYTGYDYTELLAIITEDYFAIAGLMLFNFFNGLPPTGPAEAPHNWSGQT